MPNTKRRPEFAPSTVALALAMTLVVTACDTGVDTSDTALAALAARVTATACGKPTVGTAVAVDDGLLLTNAHVVAGVEGGVDVLTPDGERSLPATVVGFDPNLDLALLAAPGFSAEPVRFGTLAGGDRTVVVAVNNALELVSIEARVNRIVSARSGDIYDEGEVVRRAIDIGAEVDPGASGAGVFTEDLELAGIVFADSRGSTTTYALASQEIEAFLAATDATTPSDTGRCR